MDISEFTRRIGLELEFAGLTEEQAATTVATATGGVAKRIDDAAWHCDTPLFGTCEIYLDSALTDPAQRLGGTPALDVMRQVVPLELVTEPFALQHLDAFDQVCAALRDAGAQGSRDGILFGFGLHLNIELQDRSAVGVARHLLAFALLEDHLRRNDPIDPARRVLPFVDPYPDSLTDALADDLPQTWSALAATYLKHAPSRNHGLDLLPILAELAPAHMARHGATPDGIAARPAYHFRLPDCRIDEPDWSVRDAWGMWRAVEELAADDLQLATLRTRRLEWTDRSRLTRHPWARAVAQALAPGNKPAPA